MPGEFSVWNWVVVAIYLAGVYAIGLSASRHQKTSEDFFLAGRSMGAIPVGLSICMTLFSAVSYTALANQSYYHGLLLVMSMVMVWIDAPVVCLIVIPFFYKLKLYSIYEYLEKRFSPSVRIVGGAIFFFWRMLWLGIVIYAPCKVLQVVLELATGHAIPVELLVVVVGVATTLYTVLGGMRAVIWTDVAQFCVMFGSVIAIIAVVWLSMDQGPAEVWAYAEQGGRDKFVHAEFDLQDPWCIWGIVPFYFLARLAFYSADQITMQRVLTARDLKSAQKAFVLNCVALSIFIPLLCYVGLSLYAFYQKHPDRVPAQYQVSANEETESSKSESSKSESSKSESSKSESSKSESSPPDAWPKKHPQTGKKLEDKILPTFVALELPVGIAGLVVSALFAACMSTMDSGLNSVATSLIVDFHRRWGIGKSWLAKRLSKPVSELDEADELTLARPLVVLIGVLAIGFGCAIGQFGTIFEIARIAIDTPGIPLACIFLLGMLTIRTNTVGALCGLFAGLATMVWLAVGPKLADMGITALWPWKNENGEIWNLAPIYPGVIGAFVTVVLAYGISLLTGKHKSREELRGLSWQARDAAEK